MRKWKRHGWIPLGLGGIPYERYTTRAWWVWLSTWLCAWTWEEME